MKGSHELGGRISWEYLGNQQFIFHLELIGDPTGISLPTSAAISYGGGQIALSRDSIESIYIPYNQQNPPVKFAEIHHYSSALVTLSNLPPQGFTFEYSSCCLSGNLGNITGGSNLNIRSTMKPDSGGAAPAFSTYRPLGGQSQPPLAHHGSTGGRHQYWVGSFRPATAGYDSVATGLTSVALGSGNAFFTAGYTARAPLPDTSESSQNGPFQFDPHSGIASFQIDSGSGYDDYFLHGVEHRYFQAGHSGAMATIGSIHAIKLVEADSYNTAPSLSVSGLSSDTLRLYPGDTLQVDFLALDNAQGVIVGAHSWGLDTQYLPAGSPTMKLSSLNNSGGFYGFGLSQARLAWKPTLSSLVAGPLDIPVYLWARDSLSPGSKRVYKRLLVELRPVVQIHNGSSNRMAFSSQVCPLPLRGSTQSGQAQWQPASAVTNDTALQTTFTDTASGWVYLTDPAHPGKKDSLYVGVVDTADFQISEGPRYNFFRDSLFLGPYRPPRGALRAPSWTLNYFPLNEKGAQIKAPTSGMYRTQLPLRRQCKVTDSSFINMGPQNTGGSFDGFALHNLSHRATALAPQSLDSLYGFNFTPPAPDPYLQELHLLGLRGSAGKRADSGHVRVWLYDLKGSGPILLLHKDTLISTRFSGTLTMYDDTDPGFVSLGSMNRSKQLIWQVDSNLQINLLQGDIGAGDTIGFDQYQALRGKDTTRLLAQRSDHTLATSMHLLKAFDLEERALPTRSLHPNPARDKVYWEKPLEEDQEVVIRNTTGQELARIELPAGATELPLPDLAGGLYLIKLESAHYRLRIKSP
jgi:hypothetical protein